jgi:hypothetical protein
MFPPRKTVLALAVLAGLLAVAAMSYGAPRETVPQDKKKANMQDPPKDAKDSDTIKAVKNIELAYKLVGYGRQEKSAESLLLAAQILHKNPTQELKAGFTVTGGMPADKAMAAKNAVTPKILLAEAKKMSSSPQVEALAAATDKMLQEGTRGAVGGPKSDFFSIAPGQTITWKPVAFRANEKAVVDVEYVVFGRLVLEVYDDNGNLVGRDNIPDHFVNVTWYPIREGTFTFRLTNNDTIAFACSMLTN